MAKDQRRNLDEPQGDAPSLPTLLTHPTPTESVDLSSLLTTNLTESGSFSALNTTHTSFYRLLRALPIAALVIDESQTILFCNEAWGRSGVNYEGLVGLRFSSLFNTVGHVRDMESVVRHVLDRRMLKVAEGKISIEGHDLWVRTYFRPIRLADNRACLVLFEDLTLEKKQILLMNKIQRAKREWERTFDVVPDLIAVLDTDYRIVRINRAMADRLGVAFQDAIGKHCYELFHKSGRPPEHCPNARLLAVGGSHSTEVAEESLDAVFEVSVSPLQDENDRTIGSVHVARDITDRKKTEKLLLESGRSKAVSELAGVVAHGLSDLTQIVMGGAQLALTNLELGNLSDIKNNLERILDNSRFGAATIKYLNYLARAHAETPYSGAKVLDLSRTVHQALDIARPWWKINPERAGINIVVNRNLGPGCFVSGNENEFFEILINLVKNAVEALPNGGIINVATFAKRDSVFLEVRDGGVGIPKETLPKIFEPLWTSKGMQGTGMGLVRTRNIVEQHRGTITVESQEGKGTTFTVILPRTEPQRKQTETPASEELGPALNVLVADDSEPLLRMLREAFTAAGHRVFAALSGRKAVEIFNAARIDVVICDSEMPEMNGWQVSSAIMDKCHKEGATKPPIILLMGLGGQGAEQDKMLEYGVDTVFEKPVEINNLLKVVRSLARKAAV